MTGHQASRAKALRRYAVTYVVLCGLAGLSWLLSELPIHSGIVVALLIAAVKAALVMGVFMHLAAESASFKAAIVVALALVAILIILTTADPLTRAPYPPGPRENSAFSVQRSGAVPPLSSVAR